MDLHRLQEPLRADPQARPVVIPLLAAATPADLFAARTQMALSLGWHIVVACLGVGTVLLVSALAWLFILFQRTDPPPAA
jgi:hypothetical protein